MLRPEYFNQGTDLIESYYEDLENWLMNDIAQRLLKAGEMSGTADRNIWLLEQLGLQKSEINRRLQKMTGLSNKELKAILEDAVLTSWKDDAKTMASMGKAISSPLTNDRYMRLIQAEYQKCKGELNNLTRTTMDTAQQDLIRMLNEAEMRISSGSQSYSSAICEILDEYAKKGMQVGYPTVKYFNDAGEPLRATATKSIEAAVQTAIRTSMNQTAANITNQYINENGVEYVLVSAHLGARHSKRHPEGLESHDWWQGKVFKIRGSEKGIPNLLESTGYDIDPLTGAGVVVNPLGLHGYNCRHSHQPWDKDLKNPWLDSKGRPIINQSESQEKYENEQKQRSMERAIRSTKRQLVIKNAEINGVAETDVREILKDEYNNLENKLKEQKKAYDMFCNENDLQKQDFRLKVIKFKRSNNIQEASISTIATSSKLTDTVKKASIIREASNSKIPCYADDLRTVYNRIKPEDGYYDVAIHGQPTFVEYEHKYLLDSETLALIISGRRDYKPEFFDIRLLSCSTGKADKEGNCFAQELANRLGVNVKAPIDVLNIDGNSGKLTVGRQRIPFDEASIIFLPGGGTK